MSIYAIYFSPTGGTEKIVTFIAEQFGVYQSIDLCEKTSDLTNDFPKKISVSSEFLPSVDVFLPLH